MRYTSKKLTVIITAMAACVAVILGLGLPLAYFGVSYFYLDAALETEAEINARIVTQLINANPEMWRYEELRLVELMSRRPAAAIPETRSIRDLNGTVIAKSVEKILPPVHSRKAALMDSGRTVGTIEISRSLDPVLERTAALALAGTLLGLAAFVTLRTVPLRILRRTLGSLYEEKERAHVTLRSIGDGVITTDAQGKVELLNPVAEALTGWRQEAAQGRPLQEIFRIVNEQTRIACENPVDRVLREMRVVELANNTLLIAKDGTERVIADSGAPILGADGRLIGMVLVFRDITEKKMLVEEMQKAAKLDSLGVLAGGIAHDFNNILTAIMGNVSLALITIENRKEIEGLLQSAENACHRAKDLTHQLLTFSKGGMPVTETVSLNELIASSAEFALTGSNVRPEVLIADSLPPANIDAGQINQVMHNLMINAMESMPEGGIVTVRGDLARVAKSSGLPLPEGEYVRISVQDRGVGIPRELLTRIFDPYFTTKQRGSGLGLATCYSIIRKHGGHITVESELGKGSMFHFYLPASSAAVAPRKVEPAPRITPGSGTILLMDDEEAICSTVGQMLTLLGYQVVFAHNGSEAVSRYRDALAAAKPFDAVILDLTIPGGMGGKEAVQYLLELDPGVKAIVSSGYSENPVMSDYFRYGFRGVLSKPYDVQQMSRVLHMVLQEGNNPPAP